MKTLLFYSVILLCGCNSLGENIDNPILNEQQIVFTNLPDSILVETSVSFSFNIVHTDPSEYFEVSIDTIVPSYTLQYINWDNVPPGASQIPENAIIKLDKKGIDILVNGIPQIKDVTIKAGQINTVTLSNALVVGNYVLIFKIKDRNNQEIKKSIQLKVVSPEVIIKIWNIDPWLDLGIYDKNFYEILNDRYTYEPLSAPFVNKEVDTVYSYERPKPGHPGEWAYLGLGLTVYVGGQAYAKEFTYQTDERELNISFCTNWDNDIKYPANTVPQKAGFHCLELTAWEHAKSGSFPLVLKLTDHWGKETQKTLIVNAIPGH